MHFSRQEVKNAEFGHLMALFSKLQLKLVFKKEKKKRTRSKVEKERQLSMFSCRCGSLYGALPCTPLCSVVAKSLHGFSLTSAFYLFLVVHS